MIRYGIGVFFVVVSLCLLQGAVAQIEDGMVLYLSLDEGKGEIAGDSSGNGNDGTLIEGPDWVQGKYGGALEFDGESNYVQIDIDPSTHATDGVLSIAAWVKVLDVATDGHDQTRQPIVMKGSGGEWEFALYVYDTLAAGFSVWQCSGTGVAEPSGGALLRDEWNFVVGTFELGEADTVYVDGEEVIQGNAFIGAPCDGSRPVMLAYREDGQYLNAVIDEVGIWERVLSPDEVLQLMDHPLGSLAVRPDGRLTTTWGRLKH